MIRWLARDTGMKLISLILAVGLWYYAVGEEGIELTRAVPLVIEIENEQMSLLKTSVDVVKVTFAVPRTHLSKLANEELRAVHRIGPDVKSAGDYSFRLNPSAIKLPSPAIRVTKIDPEDIRVVLDELILKKLEVRPAFLGKPAFGYEVTRDEIELDPNAVLVEGPKQEVDRLSAVTTEAMDLVGRIRSFRRTVELDLPPTVKPLSEALIDVFVPIHEEFDEKGFTEIPVKVLAPPDKKIDVKIEPPQVSFVLKGSRRKLEKMTVEEIKAYLDITGLDVGEHDVAVQVLLPEDVSLVDASKVKVKVKIKK
ncbi:MAG: CdaR family protein [Candidatus Omnitrophota bacterium]|nr:CdaR family protein [Candidatus Omnitrophota bacterium]